MMVNDGNGDDWWQWWWWSILMVVQDRELYCRTVNCKEITIHRTFKCLWKLSCSGSILWCPGRCLQVHFGQFTVMILSNLGYIRDISGPDCYKRAVVAVVEMALMNLRANVHEEAEIKFWSEFPTAAIIQESSRMISQFCSTKHWSYSTVNVFLLPVFAKSCFTLGWDKLRKK